MSKSSRNSPWAEFTASMALEAIVGASEEVRRLETLLAEARAVRDDLLVDARESGVSVTRLIRASGLSRERITKIAGKLRDNED